MTMQLTVKDTAEDCTSPLQQIMSQDCSLPTTQLTVKDAAEDSSPTLQQITVKDKGQDQ